MHTPQSDVLLVCTNCKKQLDTIRHHRFFTNDKLTLLESPRRALIVHVPVTMDDGSTRVVEGFRIQYNDVLGPTKGGIRMHQDADYDEVAELAFLMSLKTSLVGLPYGGAKGAIKINPKELSGAEHERVIRGFIRQIAHFIGPERDIPAPDVNTNAETMALMLDEYERVIGKKSPATFTGKPFALGGSLGRDSSTSKGGFYIIQEYFSAKGRKDTGPEKISVAIQGFGNVGSNLGEMLHETGFTIAAVSDSSGGIYSEQGLPMEDVIRWKRDGKQFADFENQPGKNTVEKISNEELLELAVDILIPSALGGVITETNASKIQASVIVEMANAPIAPEADQILKEKEVVVIPDILANSGGVIVSYFEWLQNREDEQWTREKVNEELKRIILSAYKKVQREYERRPQLDMRTVSYLLAIKRILEAETGR